MDEMVCEKDYKKHDKLNNNKRQHSWLRSAVWEIHNKNINRYYKVDTSKDNVMFQIMF